MLAISGAYRPKTTLSGNIDAVVTTIPVVSTAGFPASGYVGLNATPYPTGAQTEEFSYVFISGNNFMSCTRGTRGSSATSHTTGESASMTGDLTHAATTTASTATCELYDPTAGTWSSTGSVGTARESFSTVLLQNGKVLIFGGINPIGGAYIDSSELYNPTTGTWSAAATIPHESGHPAHQDPQVVLLPNGKVLVAGGIDSVTGAVVSSSDLYDPATNTWSSTGNLNVGRYWGMMTVTDSNTVELSGGTTSNVNPLYNGTTVVEVYNITTGIWSLLTTSNTVRIMGSQLLMSLLLFKYSHLIHSQ